MQLHGCCDASTVAYAAVIYFRFSDGNGAIKTSFIMAKTRVAPIKQTSVPRLELMAAHCLAKLAQYVIEGLKSMLDFHSVHLWSDSKIVLAWLSKPSYCWKTFVKNRVQEIHDCFEVTVWKHCAGVENPADGFSRGMH